MKLIDKDALVAEIERMDELNIFLPISPKVSEDYKCGYEHALEELLSFINTLEVKEVDLDKQAEWIANGIMIAVQSAKLHTNVYNPDRKDYDHSHLMQAAMRGIKLGLKIAQRGE